MVSVAMTVRAVGVPELVIPLAVSNRISGSPSPKKSPTPRNWPRRQRPERRSAASTPPVRRQLSIRRSHSRKTRAGAIRAEARRYPRERSIRRPSPVAVRRCVVEIPGPVVAGDNVLKQHRRAVAVVVANPLDDEVGRRRSQTKPPPTCASFSMTTGSRNRTAGVDVVEQQIVVPSPVEKSRDPFRPSRRPERIPSVAPPMIRCLSYPGSPGPAGVLEQEIGLAVAVEIALVRRTSNPTGIADVCRRR